MHGTVPPYSQVRGQHVSSAKVEKPCLKLAYCPWLNPSPPAKRKQPYLLRDKSYTNKLEEPVSSAKGTYFFPLYNAIVSSQDFFSPLYQTNKQTKEELKP
jgi:hypothetical protein